MKCGMNYDKINSCSCHWHPNWHDSVTVWDRLETDFRQTHGMWFRLHLEVHCGSYSLNGSSCVIQGTRRYCLTPILSQINEFDGEERCKVSFCLLSFFKSI